MTSAAAGDGATALDSQVLQLATGPAEAPKLSGETVLAVAKELARLAERFPDPASRAALRRARSALFQQGGGRRPKNDRKLLQDVDSLLAAGLAKSENDAIAKVAATISVDARSLKANTERLRRKRRKAPKSSHDNV